MMFRLSTEQETLRGAVKEFLASEGSRGGFSPVYDGWLTGWSQPFSEKLAANGWIGITFPREYGGRQGSYLDRLVVTEEFMRAGAPVACHWHADRQVGPAILSHGSPEQKEWFLPRIAKAKVSFSIGMSEPGAGSDLASLSTRADPDGGGFVVNGQKVFITNAHRASFIYLVARTDQNAVKHRGLSEFLVDLKVAGITVRPLVDATGAHEFNEVFFDNVRLPATALLGELNKGWNQVVRQLDYERAGIERLMGNYRFLEDMTAFATRSRQEHRPLAADATVRARLAELAIEMEVGRLLIYRVAWMLTQANVPSYEAAMAKTYGSEFQQRLASTGMQVLGLYGQLLPGSSYAVASGLPPLSFLRSVMQTIGGGTSEVLRNIVAARGLNLPSK